MKVRWRTELLPQSFLSPAVHKVSGQPASLPSADYLLDVISYLITQSRIWSNPARPPKRRYWSASLNCILILRRWYLRNANSFGLIVKVWAKQFLEFRSLLVSGKLSPLLLSKTAIKILNFSSRWGNKINSSGKYAYLKRIKYMRHFIYWIT